VSTPNIDLTSVQAILPEILLLALGILVLILDPFLKEGDRRNLGWLTGGGSLVIVIVSLLVARPGIPTMVFGGMLRYDWLGFYFKMLFIFSAAVTALFMMDVDKLNRRGEA